MKLHLENIASKSLDFTNLTFLKTSGTKLTKIWSGFFMVSVIKHFQQQFSGKTVLVVESNDNSKLVRATQSERTILYETESQHSSYQLECFLRMKRDRGEQISLVVISDFMQFNDGHFSKTIKDFDKLSREFGCLFLLRGAFRWHEMKDYNVYEVRKLCRSKRLKYKEPIRNLNLYELKCISFDSGNESLSISINDSFLHFPNSLIPYLE